MLKRIVLGLFIVLLPGAAWAQQENYLPAKSQLYFRWDGMKKHQAAYDKTALGKMMQGETGKFVDELWKFIDETLQNAAGNGDPRIGPALKDVGKFISTIHHHGVLIGAEVDRVNPPQAQAVIVFPKGAGETGSVMPLIQKIVQETKAPAKSTKVGKRFVGHINIQALHIGWWDEGVDAVIFLGTTDPVAYAKAIDGKTTGLAGHPLYKKVVSFKEFPTATRGYLDVAGVLNVISDFSPAAGPIIDELGFKALKSMTFASGFDGPAERSIVDTEIAGPRKGLLSLTSQKKISMKDLPVLPNDLSTFSASSISLNKSYGVLTNVVDGIVRVFDPNLADNIKEQVKAFEGAVGVDIEKELFGNLGDVMVSYSSPSDGIFSTGAVVAVQVKDGKKLTATIEKITKAIPAIPMVGQFVLKKKPYHGGDITQITLAGESSSHVATLGTYKNWLIYAQYPQPVKGFILRQQGELPAWQADDRLNKVLAQFPKEFTSIKVTDPRPTVQTLLAVTPFIMDLANTGGGLAAQAGFLPNFRPFDLELIPHSQFATQHLFPNVTISTDDGKRIRTESRGSLLGF